MNKQGVGKRRKATWGAPTGSRGRAVGVSVIGPVILMVENPLNPE